MRTLSPAALAALNAQESGEVWLPLIEIEAEGWEEIERFAAMTWEPVTSGGVEYTPLPFRVGLPDEIDTEDPGEVELSIDNVHRAIGEALRQVTGRARVMLRLVLASQPDTVEFGPLALNVVSHQLGAQEVTFVLSPRSLMDQVVGQHTLSSQWAPGLF